MKELIEKIVERIFKEQNIADEKFLNAQLKRKTEEMEKQEALSNLCEELIDFIHEEVEAYNESVKGDLISRSAVIRELNGIYLDNPYDDKEDILEKAIGIVDQLAEEYNNGWITDRNPTREECGEYGHAEFQVTIPQSKGNKTITMDFVYETVRGKEVARWKWCGRLPIWEVLAWKPLDAPYQPKGE